MPDAKKSTKKEPSIGRTFGVVAILTVFSKIAGLARDVVVSSCYGTSIVADAYNYAYLLTGNILILFGGLGGPFHSATVAVLGPKKDDKESGALIGQIFLYTAITLGAIALLTWLLAPLIVPIMSANYQPSKEVLAKGLSTAAELRDLFSRELLAQLNIMLPLVVIAGLVGISYGILNAHNKVFWPSVSPSIASLAIIVAVLGFSNPETRLLTGIPLAVGTLAGALGQLLAQIPGTIKSAAKLSFSFKPQPGLKEYSLVLFPAIFSTSVGQLTVYVDAGFTCWGLGEGAWTAIVTANRLVQLPLGVLLTAMLVPILPRFTEQASEEKHEDLKEEFRRSLRFLWFLALPLTAIFLAIPEATIRLLFQRGNWTEESTAMVSIALIWLTPSIFFYVARDLITRVFYAYKDARTPFVVALIAIGVKSVLDYLVVTQSSLGVGGISLATSLITILNLSLLIFFLRRKVGRLGLKSLIAPLAVMLTAATACFGATFLLQAYLKQALLPYLAEFQSLLFSVGLASLSGMLAYTIVCLIFRLDEPLLVARRLPIFKNILPKS